MLHWILSLFKFLGEFPFQYKLSHVIKIVADAMERNCDVITFISKYLILIRRRVANFAGIIRIATMFIEKKVQRIINYVLKMQPISVFLNITKVPVFGAKMLI